MTTNPLKAVVFGVGRMGTAISYAMSKLGHYVVGIDSNPDSSANFRKHISGENGVFYCCDGRDYKDIIGKFERPEIVISSLPYHQTQVVAEFCIDSGIRYCDLGGRVDVSNYINDYARKHAEKPVMTDLGLAPGWVNILAEEGYRKLYGSGKIISVNMMVGGLPEYSKSNENPLRYGITWSVDGLINEYRDDCLILKNGEIVTVKGMGGLESVETESLGKLEAFYTSGGASHSIHTMKERGVENCSYKTLRYQGHRNLVKFLIKDCELSDKEIEKIFINGCGLIGEDEVIIYAEVLKDNKRWKEEKLIKSDSKFSAMQKSTAFPISSVASLMANGVFDGKKEERRGYHTEYPANLSYSDVPYEKFEANLSKLLT